MSFFDRLQKETADEQKALMEHPFIQAGLAGKLSLASYMAFLEQAYHHVRHTAPLMMGAGLRFTGSYEKYRPAMSEYIEEEIGHDEWILNDIEVCGGDKEAVRNGQPSLPCELMVAFTYDVVQRRNPIGIFGMVHVLEGTSIKAATPAAEALQQGLGLPKKAFTYLTTHGSLDMEHYEFFTRLMNEIESKEDQDWIIHCAKTIFGLYKQMFDQLPLETNDAVHAQNGAAASTVEGASCN